VLLDETKKSNLSLADKKTNILLYLKRYDGDWKNTREIATYSSQVSQNTARVEPILEELTTRGLISKREAENPQAKVEYKITNEGKLLLQKLASMISDPDIKYFIEIKTEKFDE